jgi:hypothetical protein
VGAKTFFGSLGFDGRRDVSRRVEVTGCRRKQKRRVPRPRGPVLTTHGTRGSYEYFNARCLLLILVPSGLERIGNRVITPKMIFESPDPIPSNVPPSGRIVYDHVLPEKTAFDPNSPAFIDGITGRIITRAELRRDTLRLGQGIHELKPRDAGREGKEPVVLIFSPNTMDYPVQFLGVQAAGCIASLVNASYLTDELAHQIRDGTPFLIFIHPTLVEILESALTLLKAEGHDTAAIKVYSTSSEGISSDKADKHHYPSYQTLYAKSTSNIAVGYGRVELSAQEIDDTPAVLCYSSGTVSLLHASCHIHVT